MANNLIHSNTSVDGAGVYVQKVGNLYNNTIAQNSGDGVFVLNGGTANLVNNIIALNANGVKRYNTLATVTTTCNDVHGNTTANYVNMTDPTGTNGNISQNPSANTPPANADYSDLPGLLS